MDYEGFEDLKKDSILLKDERANSIFEYERNHMIISLAETDILFVKDFQKTKVIKDRAFDDIHKYYFAKLHGFDAHTYPFICCAGFKSISLINVRSMKMQAFVDVSCNTSYG